MSQQAGAPQIFVVPYPGPGGKWQVSAQLGWEGRWSKTGHEIFYTTGNQMVAAPYTVENGAFQVGKPEVLFQDRFELRVPFPSYDVSPDGQHFVMFQSSSGRSLGNTLPTVILNWMNQVRSLVASAQTDTSK
jgi:hypothetical protein